MKKDLMCILLIMIMTLTCSCSKDSETTAQTQADSSGAKTVVDLSGDEVKIPDDITGIITRVNTASFVAAMGKADLLKGTYKYMKNDKWSEFMYPALGNSENFPSTPTAESFYELDANVCIWSDRETAESLRSQGISALTMTINTPEDMRAVADLMGEIFNNRKWSENWNSYYSETLAEIEKRVNNIEDKKTVYYVHGAGNEGIYHTAAGGTISETWIVQSGGNFATHDTTGFGIDITPEELINIDPEVIVIGGIYYESMKDTFYSDTTLSQISAVKNNNIYNVPVGLIPWDQYGVEYPLLCLWTAMTLYPEQFEDIGIIDETIKFYEDFCGVKLTKEQAQYMIEGKAPDGGKLLDE